MISIPDATEKVHELLDDLDIWDSQAPGSALVRQLIPIIVGQPTAGGSLPDVHVYLDTSGLSRENDYRSLMVALMAIAKVLGVALNVNSFSHTLSNESPLAVEGRPLAELWAEFAAIRKVSGGTDFTLVWDYINASPERQSQISVLITDFQWYPPAVAQVEHPANLYYVPVAPRNWTVMFSTIKWFIHAMGRVGVNLQDRVLGCEL